MNILKFDEFYFPPKALPLGWIILCLRHVIHFLWLQTIYIPAQSQRVGRFFAFLPFYQVKIRLSI